jgi:hypothetical protein
MERARSYRRFKNTVLDLLAEREQEVVAAPGMCWEEHKAAEAQRKADFIGARRAHADRVADARDLGEEEARRMRMWDCLAPDDRYAVEKARVKEFYGPRVVIDAERAYAFLYGREREQVEAFAWYAAAVGGYAKYLAMEHAEEIQAVGATRVLPRMRRTRAIDNILTRGFGIPSLLGLQGDFQLPPTNAKQMAYLTGPAKEDCLVLKLSHPVNIKARPRQLLGDVLQKLGVEYTNKQLHRPGGAGAKRKSEYVFTISRASVDRMVLLAASCRSRILKALNEGAPTDEEIADLAEDEPDDVELQSDEP